MKRRRLRRFLFLVLIISQIGKQCKPLVVHYFSTFRFRRKSQNCLLGNTPIPLKHQLAVDGYAFVPNAFLFFNKEIWQDSHLMNPAFSIGKFYLLFLHFSLHLPRTSQHFSELSLVHAFHFSICGTENTSAFSHSSTHSIPYLIP